MPRYAGLRSIAQIVERSQQVCSFLVGTAQLVESPRDGADAQRLRGVQIEDLADHLGLRLDDLVVGRALLGLAHVAIAIRGAAEHADLALLGAMAFAAA